MINEGSEPGIFRAGKGQLVLDDRVRLNKHFNILKYKDPLSLGMPTIVFKLLIFPARNEITC